MKKNTYPGKFIVFEGLDGSGQTTQATMLADFFNKSEKKLVLGRPEVYLTKEPTSGLIGGLIRGQLSHDWKSSPACTQLLFAADRAHHLEKEIIPLLEKGIHVICDRYFFSTIAYGAAAGLAYEWLKTINDHFLLPDIFILLKVSPLMCAERIKKSRFSLELFEQEEFLGEVWKNFEKLAEEFENVYIIDGERPIEEVFEQVKQTVLSQLNQEGG